MHVTDFDEHGNVVIFQGPTFIKRNAFLKTYQEIPSFDIVSEDHRLLDSGAVEPAMEGGLGPSWAIARMWFWGLSMLLLAKVLCDKEVHPWFHRHVTNSGMIIYVCHYLFLPSVCSLFYKSGLTDPAELTYATIGTTFLLCFVAYGVVISNPYSAKAFGIIPFSSNSSSCRDVDHSPTNDASTNNASSA